ncbi:AMP-binding protein [Cryobacterium sp. SO2]|uniref:AMP-binding protein n=1 Tax=Cryobacterium sp. SO2 TaxID=1897060 RepID=UPI00223CA6AA|nr:AMP-binding protein [Cryobacterium sp. SO2]WEO77306.1 AMP-binding protein [Cryobacterium sp. SO2]
MSGTLFDWMIRHAERTPNEAAVIVDAPDGSVSHSWTDLSKLTARIRGGLLTRNIRAGDRVALSLPNGVELIASFLAILAEGAVAVVLPTPGGRRDSSYVSRLSGVWSDCAPVLLIEADELAERRRAFPAVAGLRAVPIVELCGAQAAAGHDAARRVPSSQAALLQYTSGSTRTPRGVVVTNRMIQANCRQAAEVYGDRADDVVVSWVPLYHDMGLVTAVMRPLFAGYTTVLQQPTDFVADPLRWLRAISRYGGTLSSAPDFAYAYCARRLTPADLIGLDLSRWRVARDAGELVRPSTFDAFVELTRAARFAPETFCPSYGMAEATLTVTATTPSSRPMRVRVDREQLIVGNRVVRDSGSHELVSSGMPVSGTVVRVADGDDRGGSQDGRVGELEVSGPQVAEHYYSAPIPRSPEGGIRTGDLGFVLEGHVFVLGRHDDVVVVNGVNCFQQDITEACAGVAGVRAGRIAAFVDDRDPSRQSLVVLVESSKEGDVKRMAGEIRSRVFQALGLIVGHTELVAPGELPVTTSGKVRIAAARDAWLAATEAVAR